MTNPLADRIRPESLEQVVGQQHLLGSGKALRQLIESGDIPNLIFYGPPGVGKTTVASIIAKRTDRALRRLNGTNASTADIRALVAELDTLSAPNGILLYLDEIQYFNKRQQQSLLEYIENGKITLIASTTENPYFYIYPAVLSRCTVFEFKSVTPVDVVPAVERGFRLLEEENGTPAELADGVARTLAERGGGDVRKSLGAVENCYFAAQVTDGKKRITPELVDQLTQKSGARYDRLGDEHYDIISAYQKSMRGSDPDAALHYLARLLEAVNRNFDLSRCLEFTVEGGRPDTLDPQKLRVIKDGGATRISINPQTFSDEVLRNIGRRHTAQDILDCYRTARRVGHDNINMDLIAGLPGDTVEGFRHSLQTAIDLDPENITVHTLTLKRASNLVVEHRAADYADVAAMVESCELLEKAGYRPYYLYRQKGTLQNLENVGWCKPGYECLYNIYIMEEVHTILSAGAGGSTKLVAPGARHGKIERIFNYKYPTEYIDRFDTILARKEGVKQFYDQYPSCGESARPQAHGGV